MYFLCISLSSDWLVSIYANVDTFFYCESLETTVNLIKKSLLLGSTSETF